MAGKKAGLLDSNREAARIVEGREKAASKGAFCLSRMQKQTGPEAKKKGRKKILQPRAEGWLFSHHER